MIQDDLIRFLHATQFLGPGALHSLHVIWSRSGGRIAEGNNKLERLINFQKVPSGCAMLCVLGPWPGPSTEVAYHQHQVSLLHHLVSGKEIAQNDDADV